MFRFKTWKILFYINDALITIQNIYSGYNDYTSLSGNDKQEDLAVHKIFNEKFKTE